MSCQETWKFFNSEKGFDFISPSDGSDDLFAHHSDINSNGFKSLNDDVFVHHSDINSNGFKSLSDSEYDENKGKSRAVNVDRISYEGGGKCTEEDEPFSRDMSNV